MFRMEPDLLVEHGDRRWLLDAKWKRLDASDRANKYGLSQADFYQLFAYGQKYLAGRGAMALIYPFSKTFGSALPVFDFDKGLCLWALPFDLDAGQLVDGGLAGLPMRAGGHAKDQLGGVTALPQDQLGTRLRASGRCGWPVVHLASEPDVRNPSRGGDSHR